MNARPQTKPVTPRAESCAKAAPVNQAVIITQAYHVPGHPLVSYDNNHGERMIRPAVIIRKNNQSNRSDKGTTTQSVLMSIYRTLKLRGQDPLATVVSRIRTRLATGQLPPLPIQSVADG